MGRRLGFRLRWKSVLRLLVTMTASSAAAGAAAQTIKFSNKNNIFYAECGIDDVADLCQIDTGDSGLLTVRPTPTFQAYPALRQSRSMGVSGKVASTNVIRIRRFTIGEHSLMDVEADTKPQPDSFSRVGLKLFRQVGRVTFDFRKGEVTAERPDAKTRCPLTFTSMIQIPIAVSGRATSAIWDTGASHTIASDALVKATPEAFQYVRDLTPASDSTSSGVPVRLFTMKHLAFCGRDFPDIPVIVMDLSAPTAADATFPQVIIGANLMVGHRWAFDFTDRTWSFD